MADIDVEEHAKLARLIRNFGIGLGLMSILMIAFVAARAGGAWLGVFTALLGLVTLFLGWLAGRATGELARIRDWK